MHTDPNRTGHLSAHGEPLIASYFAQNDTLPINEQLPTSPYSLGEKAWNYLNRTLPISEQPASRPTKEEYIIQRLQQLESAMIKKYGKNARLKGQLRLAITLEKRYTGVRR